MKIKKLILKILKKIINILSFLEKLNKYFFYIISNSTLKNSFFTYHLRPKNIDEIIDDKIQLKNKKEKTAIVMQGPLVYEDDFTYNTLKLYKNIFKDDELILSIWDNESQEYLKKIKQLGVYIIENKKPETGGFINLNYQIVSASSGIKKAEELNCKYALKTRTDIRIYETGVKNFLISLLEVFPSKSKEQLNRIIGIDINTHKYGIGMSDIFQFGTTTEILKMWDGQLYPNKEITSEEYHNFEKNSTAIDRFNLEFAECYLLKNYLKKNNIELKPSLKSYYEVLKNNFIIIDSSMINLFWNKYLGDEYKEWKNYSKKISNSCMSFKDWLTIYNNDYSVNENVLLKTYDEWKKMTIEDVENEKYNDSSKC